MKEFVCKKCGSIDLFIKYNGASSGLYCSDCGTWQKWLGKEEKLLAERWIIHVNCNTNELKPCPFCGSEAEIKYDVSQSAAIRCKNKCVVQCGTAFEQSIRSEEEAIKKWNKRI